MASVCDDGNGRKRILVVLPDGSRKAIRLGKATAKQPDDFKVKLQSLITAATAGGGIDDDVARWLAERPDDIHAKLAAFGLCKPRAKTAAALGAFIDGYTASRADVKTSTGTVYARCRRLLVLYFMADKLIRDITPGDADAWRLWLVGHKLAENTSGGRLA
jgi:hypothetical protein